MAKKLTRKERDVVFFFFFTCLVGFGVVGLLLALGVVGRDFLGVVWRLANDPDRRRGNLCGETVRLSIHQIRSIRIAVIDRAMQNKKNRN